MRARSRRDSDFRALLAVPLMREGGVYGAILIWRREPGPFSPDQIALLQTFARQAAIAIDNVRLFNETKSSLEQQTAISEILRVISSSPTDVQPVLDAVAERAAHLCNSPYARVLLVDGDVLRARANYRREAGPDLESILLDAVAAILDQRPRRARPPDRPLRGHRAAARHRVSGRAPEHRAGWHAGRAGRAADARRRCLRKHLRVPARAGAVRAGPGRADRDLRPAGGDRHRQRAAVQRDEGGARAADGDQRDPARHLELAHRRAARARCDRRAGRAAVRCVGRVDVPDRRRRAAASRVEGPVA